MLCAVVLLASLGLVPPLGSPSPSFQLIAADGVHVYAQAFESANPNAPRLNQLGFNALAIDQRSGGELYQPPNETVLSLGRSTKYEDVMPDMEAALTWAEKIHPGSPVYAWGSSYSAALVFLLAAKHPKEIAALIAFSPAEYLADKTAVQRAAAKVHLPVFVDSAADPQEIAAASSILNVVPSKKKTQYKPRAGIHGSATLRVDRDADGAELNWNAVTRFLRSLTQR